jgi:hypothetical protein
MAWRRLNLRWKLASGITIELKSPADWEAYNEIFVSAEYDSAILRALQQGGLSEAKPLAVLDLGFFSLRVLHLAKALGLSEQGLEFTMVEGSRRVLGEFKHRDSYHILTNHNARIIHGLAGNKTGSALLYESDVHLFNSIVDQRRSGTRVPFVEKNRRRRTRTASPLVQHTSMLRDPEGKRLFQYYDSPAKRGDLGRTL